MVDLQVALEVLLDKPWVHASPVILRKIFRRLIPSLIPVRPNFYQPLQIPIASAEGHTVRKPLPRGEYAMIGIPSSRAASNTPSAPINRTYSGNTGGSAILTSLNVS